MRVGPSLFIQHTHTARSVTNQAFGTYASGGGKKLTYRVKKSGTYGGYKIITEVCRSVVSVVCVE